MNEKKLIEILLDESASVSERDDAAMDLSAFNSNEVLETLLKVGMDNRVDDVILSSVGESLAEIWLRNNNFNFDSYNGLCTTTKFAIKENMDVN
ncbi:MAG: hypothetical protein ACK5C0_07600 [Candidatus Kapaibacterium sp.]|jgi:hypothetical protein